MSQIAQLLIEQARQAAAARQASGALWGNTVANIAQAPAAYLETQRVDQAQKQALELARNREGREVAAAADAHQLHAAQLDQMRQAQAGDWAAHLISAGITDPDAVAKEVDAATGKLWKPEEAQAIKATLAAGPEATQQFLAKLAPIREGVKEVDPTKDLIDPRSGKVIRPGTKAPPKNPTELAWDAADPASPTQARSTTAIDLSKPPKPEPVPRPLEQQLLDAVIAGDQTKIGQIKQTMLTAAQAKQDPEMAKLARELAGLRKDEAQQRLDKLSEQNKPLDISPDVQTTRSGAKYVDMSGYSAEQRDRARAAANAAGVVPISKEQANALQEIDNARANQTSIFNQIKDLLPRDAFQRGGALLNVPLNKLFQTQDQIAAYNSWRTAAIQTLRATAGSKGLRINKAEIEQAIENDIPKLTDTASVAKQKVENINTLLDNAEKSIVVRDRSALVPPTLAAGKTQRVVQNGVTYEVTTDAKGNVTSQRVVP